MVPSGVAFAAAMFLFVFFRPPQSAVALAGKT
jgi:hypothetical protein